MKIKYFAVLVVFVVLICGFGSVVKAQTTDNQELINQIKLQITKLQLQLKILLLQQEINQTTSQNSNQIPMLEAYVVARCPYGLQMQRAMAEAVKGQPDLAKYIKARYIGSVLENTITSMHGEEEAAENLRQICIREEQPAKYWDYVGCQMKASGTETSCEASTGVDSSKLSACISDVTRGVSYAKEDFDLAEKYSILGSPTMILGGKLIDESSYGGRSADGVKSMVCSRFETKPSFCSQALNVSQAAVSFSSAYEKSSSNSLSSGGCGSAQ